ncbi:MAG: class I SAM-dependent methyltransferase [Syntrophales bacterium]|nr:class I SAM-dependent methyltransferase [Syntrophales bacterium]
MEKAPDICILCGGTERKKLLDNRGWSVYACQTCGLGILDPRPDKEELSRLYAESYFTVNYGPLPELGSREMGKRLSQETHRIRFFRRYLKRGKILDIGCGMGYFLLACRQKGYEVRGLDISENSASHCKSKFGLEVYIGTVEEANFEPESFDLITMWHFLEHTPNPSRCLEKVRLWLKKGGLVAIDVPNYESTDAKAGGENWKGWQIPFHLYHFTPHTIKELLKKHSFRILRTKSYLSEHIKEKLDTWPAGNIYARPVARLFSGHSFAVLAKK